MGLLEKLMSFELDSMGSKGLVTRLRQFSRNVFEPYKIKRALGLEPG
jgi:hypothetical protein